MTDPHKMTTMDEILELLSRLEGVVKVFSVEGEILKRIMEIESQVRAVMNIEVRNTGVEECLKRNHIVCIIKDSRFRPPPEPTVLLVGDDGIILGKEVIPSDTHDYKNDENVVFLSDDFIVFTDRKPNEKEYFLMPPVRFPELERLEGVCNVVSCSLSAPSDYLLRKHYNLQDDPKLASILVGFDLISDENRSHSGHVKTKD